MGTISLIRSSFSRVLIAQPASAPQVAASIRGNEIGARLRRPSSRMNTNPTRGNPMSTATPAAPPPTPAGRASLRNHACRAPLPVADPAATPRWAAGDSVPIGAPSPTVEMIASARIGASRDGKSSSCPAVRTTSEVRSARTALAGNRSHALNRRGGAPAPSTRCAARPSATRFSSNTAPTTPRNGAVSITQESWSVIQARIALIVLVTATTSTDATNPPSIPPATASAATRAYAGRPARLSIG